MLCSLFRKCIFSATNINQPGTHPVFEKINGSTQTPGVFGTINFNQPVSAYEIFTVPANHTFVLEHVSAVVTRANFPYPPENMNDYGAVGYELNGASFYHSIAFIRNEPAGNLQASHAIRIYIPAMAKVSVKVPIIPNQTGGAEANVSGYYLKT